MSRSFLADLALSVIGGAVSGALILVVGHAYLDDYAERLRAEQPTCADPQQLRALPAERLDVSGDWYQEQPDDRAFEPAKVLDGNLGSLWMPRPDRYGAQREGPFRAARRGGTLSVSFVGPEGQGQQAHDVRLLCVVNGLASEPERYKNWGRVRTVAVRSETSAEERTSVLQSLGDDTFQNAQEASMAAGRTTGLTITVLSSYTGQTVFSQDGDFCEKDTESRGGWEVAFSPGCLHAATRRSGLAEIYVYVED